MYLMNSCKYSLFLSATLWHIVYNDQLRTLDKTVDSKTVAKLGTRTPQISTLYSYQCSNNNNKKCIIVGTGHTILSTIFGGQQCSNNNNNNKSTILFKIS